MSKLIYGVAKVDRTPDMGLLFAIRIELFNIGYSVSISSEFYDSEIKLSRIEYERILKYIHGYLIERDFNVYKNNGDIPEDYTNSIFPWNIDYDWVSENSNKNNIFVVLSDVSETSKEE